MVPVTVSKKRWRFRDIQWPLLIGAAIAVMLVLAALWLMAGEGRLEIRRCEDAALFLSLETKPGTEFSLWFFHSYDRAFFEEHHRLDRDGSIVLTHMTFKSNLNGQGFEMGTYRPRPDGSAELVDINRPVPEITFRLGSPDLANHTLIIYDRRIPLLDYAEAGDMICIHSDLRCRWQRLWAKVRSLRHKGSPEPPS